MIIFAKQLPSHLLLLARAPSCAFRLEGRTIETNKMRFVVDSALLLVVRVSCGS